MATIFKRGNFWIGQWYDLSGKRKKRSTGLTVSESKKEARRIAEGFEREDRREVEEYGKSLLRILDRAGADAKAGRLTGTRAEDYLVELRRISDPKFRVVTLGEHLDAWLAGKRNLSKSSAGTYGDAKRHFVEALGPVTMRRPITELTRDQMRKALAKLHEGSLSAATINLSLRIFRSCLRQAVDDGLLVTNPATGVERLAENDSVERAPFTAEEVRRLIDHPDTSEEWRGMILLGAHTGLRLGDVVFLGREHIDGTKIVIRPKKTQRSRKTITVPLTPSCIGWIGDRKGKFFPELSTKPASTLSTQFVRIMSRVGIPSKIILPGGIEASRTFHSLRHTFASWLADGDVHADVRKKLTGHEDEGIHGRYTHHDEALSRAITVLPDFGSVLKNRFKASS